MFHSRKQIKLDSLTFVPKLDDLRRALGQAQKNYACTIELPWRIEGANLSYSLLVRAELGSFESVWTLYEGEGKKSQVVWSAPFTDLELLREVVSLTVTESTGVSDSTLSAQDGSLPSSGQETTEAAPLQEGSPKGLPEEKEERLSTADSPEVLPEGKAETKAAAPPPPLPQAASPPPFPYSYFYPGYPYPIPYPYPYPQSLPESQTSSNMAPIQPGLTETAQNRLVSELPVPNPELFSKQKNFLLGQFFVNTGIIAPDTLNLILQLQSLMAAGSIDIERAIEAIKKGHSRRSNIEMSALIKECSIATGDEKNVTGGRNAPLLGEILVKAEVISNSLLFAVLKLQEIVRSGAMTAVEACQVLKKELAASAKPARELNSGSSFEQEETAAELLVRAGLISREDRETAYGVQKQHGGRIDDILAAAGKASKKTFAAAFECEYLLSQKKIKLEQVMIALNYCERSRVGLAEAITDLGWHDDLDL